MTYRVLQSYRSSDCYYGVDLVEYAGSLVRFGLIIRRPRDAPQMLNNEFEIEDSREGTWVIRLLRIALAALWFVEQGGRLEDIKNWAKTHEGLNVE